MPAITYRGSYTLDRTVLDVRKQWRTRNIRTAARCVGGGAPAGAQARPLVRGRDG